jgi:hypothetical protein
MMPNAILFDGMAQAYADTPTRSEWGGVERGYTPKGSPFACAVQVENRNLANRGPGEAEVGSWKVYAPIEATALASGDVVDVLEGPEAGKRLRVVDPYRPRGRFQQARCVEWDGELEEVGS